jgi:mannose-6-phosphate isomerase-like protein (cupin superfamily)
MTASPDNAGPFRDRGGPVNLTEIAVGMSWSDARETLRIHRMAQSAGLIIQPLSDSENGQPDASASDTIYLIISGYGTLHCDNNEMDCTTGDVLFIPRGHPHQFERADGEIRIWRIQLIQDAADGT